MFCVLFVSVSSVGVGHWVVSRSRQRPTQIGSAQRSTLEHVCKYPAGEMTNMDNRVNLKKCASDGCSNTGGGNGVGVTIGRSGRPRGGQQEGQRTLQLTPLMTLFEGRIMDNSRTSLLSFGLQSDWIEPFDINGHSCGCSGPGLPLPQARSYKRVGSGWWVGQEWPGPAWA